MTAEKEAEKVKIEAQGKAEANRILSASLTDKILQDKGIEATLELAKSPNSKIVVVGSGDDGLPLILGNNWCFNNINKQMIKTVLYCKERFIFSSTV